MALRLFCVSAFALTLLIPSPQSASMQACCPAPPHNKPVVNADQTVVILWDAATKTEHFIRQASFTSAADDFGFLVPSPSKPELEESGNDAFPFFLKLTEPEVIKQARPSGGCAIGCSKEAAPTRGGLKGLDAPMVRVLDEKKVAGFQTVVLEADNSGELLKWLQEHEYAYSPEIEAWAKPYIGAGWKFTAFKVAKDSEGARITTGALRISFKTDRPLFPYREPDTRAAAAALGAKPRMLRIYFLGDARYEGTLTPEQPWTGTVAWSDKLTPESRAKALEMLKLPATTGPATLWLTEFEDNWPYQVAPADVYFAKDRDQGTMKRPAHIQYVSRSTPADVAPMAAMMLIFVPALVRRFRQPDSKPVVDP